ncbi:MAG: helix-turn-helix domain-containing protein [Sporolactobacillus sp.]
MTKTISDENCPIIHALSVIDGKWKLPLLWHLADNPCGIRYNELKRRLEGITNIMLTRSLRDLEADGVIVRRCFSGASPHVEYTLTAQGQALIPALSAVKAWGKQLHHTSASS